MQYVVDFFQLLRFPLLEKKYHHMGLKAYYHLSRPWDKATPEKTTIQVSPCAKIFSYLTLAISWQDQEPSNSICPVTHVTGPGSYSFKMPLCLNCIYIILAV